MEPKSKRTECTNFLIPGLPNDLSLECMTRVPRSYHDTMRCVCRGWRKLMGSAVWYSHRKKNGLTEPWLFLAGQDAFLYVHFWVMDPACPANGWKRVRGPHYQWLSRIGFGFVGMGSRFFLTGGLGRRRDDGTVVKTECYDASEKRWISLIPPFAPILPTRAYFACQAVNGTIYALGGVGTSSTKARTWSSYDPSLTGDKNLWTCQPDLKSPGEILDSVFMNGKVYARCGDSKVRLFDIAKEEWEDARPGMSEWWRGPAAVVDGRLYVLDGWHGLQTWDEGRGWWESVGGVGKVEAPPQKIAAIGKKIYMVGQGLETAVFDTEVGGLSEFLCPRSTPNLDICVKGIIALET